MLANVFFSKVINGLSLIFADDTQLDALSLRPSPEHHEHEKILSLHSALTIPCIVEAGFHSPVWAHMELIYLLFLPTQGARPCRGT